MTQKTKMPFDGDVLDLADLGELIRAASTELAGRGSSAAAFELTNRFAEMSHLLGAAWSGWPAMVDETRRVAPRTRWSSSIGRTMTFRAIREARPNAEWASLFRQTWPAYRSWYLSQGEPARPSLATCRRMLSIHMPELVPTWERLLELTGDDELAGRLLSMWDTPPFLPACSQAVLTRPSPALIRNYDYDPALFEAVVLSSKFGDRNVIGTSDCLWGLLDGLNGDGLAISLAFGGQPGHRPGFAIPLVVRYLLETTDNVRAACEKLGDIPVSMAYNLTMVDRHGDNITAFVAPGRAPELTRSPVATNHRGLSPDFPRHSTSLKSIERQAVLLEAVSAQPTANELADAFLEAPVRSTAYDKAFGTLYTAVYEPASGSVRYRWPNDVWSLDFHSPSATKCVILQE